jgi:Flp pilus assembly pilin Flp
MKNRIKDLLHDTRGSFVEYIILTGLVALFCIAGYRIFGKAIEAKVKDQAGQVGNIK